MSETDLPDHATDEIPILTDIVEMDADSGERDDDTDTSREQLIAELQTNLSVGAFTLTEQLLHSAIAEMEATLFEQVINRLRQELPELIDSVLREHLATESDDD